MSPPLMEKKIQGFPRLTQLISYFVSKLNMTYELILKKLRKASKIE